MERKTYIILDNIRSTHNVGSIFRTADGVGVQKIFLVGYTPAPVDRFGREQSEIHKTALGAEKTIEWESVSDIEILIQTLNKEEVCVVAVEQYKNSISYKDFKQPNKVAYIFGNEVGGISEKVCSLADSTIEIPMYGKKESLNVGVSAGVVLFGCRN